MTTVTITVAGAQAQGALTGVLTAGTVGAKAVFSFDGAWDGLSKTAVFQANGSCWAVLLEGDEAVIPWEALRTPKVALSIGVYGTDGEATVIPTVWADCGEIQPGTFPEAAPGLEPTLPVWAQMERRLEQLEDGNEAIDPEAIQDAVKEYLEENPVSVDPESIGAIPVPETAQVGQTLAVKAVDESGKPTQWEAKKMPHMELIRYISATEAKSINITTDASGNAFELDEAVLLIYLPFADGRASYRFSYCFGGLAWQYLTIADNQVWRVEASANAVTGTSRGTAYKFGTTSNNSAYGAKDMLTEYNPSKITKLEIAGLETGATIIFAGRRG